MYRRQRRGVERFFRNAWMQTQHAGRKLDYFVRNNSSQIRSFSQALAPMLAPENPALAAGVATIGAGAQAYSQLRDSLDRAG